jgi:hypothetical protein
MGDGSGGHPGSKHHWPFRQKEEARRLNRASLPELPTQGAQRTSCSAALF